MNKEKLQQARQLAYALEQALAAAMPNPGKLTQHERIGLRAMRRDALDTALVCGMYLGEDLDTFGQVQGDADAAAEAKRVALRWYLKGFEDAETTPQQAGIGLDQTLRDAETFFQLVWADVENRL